MGGRCWDAKPYLFKLGVGYYLCGFEVRVVGPYLCWGVNLDALGTKCVRGVGLKRLDYSSLRLVSICVGLRLSLGFSRFKV